MKKTKTKENPTEQQLTGMGCTFPIAKTFKEQKEEEMHTFRANNFTIIALLT